MAHSLHWQAQVLSFQILDPYENNVLQVVQII